MMRSMTGYGRGEARHKDLKFTVELNSVNRKQSDMIVDLPREMIELEPRIRDIVNTVVSRGRLNIVVTWHRANPTKNSDVCLDEEVAKAYMRAIQKLKRDLKLNGTIHLDMILRCPGILKLAGPELDVELVWPCIKKALKQALTGLLKMREKEGRYLHQDLVKRLGILSNGMAKVKRLIPVMVERYREQLHDRIRHSGIDLTFEDERLLKEVIFFADRSDITEEVIRLESHLAQFREHSNASEPVGRTLDFLAQEIHREINTIGSKANHAEISQVVVFMKSELEKIREQVQNIE